ncbi:three component ABC system middle component [Micromonospora sp. WMMC241]|uniref:three component ABC system middle component n=1 Tax=Micromonospora sp. WMMC241 TaxID=3015159 RepID=UPI003FA60FDF
MTRFTERLPEAAALFNPAFTARVLTESVSGYFEGSGEAMPFPMAFLALPLVLHEETRQALPRNRRKRFAAWIAENPWIVATFASRAPETVELTREGLRLALRTGMIRVANEGGLLLGTRPRPVPTAQSVDVVACVRAARIVGLWFQTTDIATAFALLGVRP